MFLFWIHQCSLWSDEFDFSLQSGETLLNMYADPIRLREELLSKRSSKMAVDELDAIVSRWPSRSVAGRPLTVVLVMDKCAPEMFADLVLSEFLLSAGFAERIIFMPKAIPWFVSDVTQHDFDWLLNEALSGSAVSEKLVTWANRWSQRFHEGSFVVETHGFWTLPFGYEELCIRSPGLYSRLITECDVLIFKAS